MEKANYSISFTPERIRKMEQQTKECKEQLRINPQIRSLIERGDIPASSIDKYPWKLHEWLKGIEPCAGCKGLAFCKQKTQGYYMAVKYDGILQKSEKTCKYMRQKLNEEAHMKYYVSDDLPENMRTVSLEEMDASNESAEYIKAVTTALASSEAYQSVYLYGNMGTGKTYIAAGFCNDHARKKEKVAFIHYPSFCTRMYSSFKDNEYKHEFNRLKYVKFLVIDDIGAESVTEWNRDSILLPLLSARYDAGLPIWFTSNCDLDTLKVHFAYSSKGAQDDLKAERILERIETMCKIQPLTGKDRRK